MENIRFDDKTLLRVLSPLNGLIGTHKVRIVYMLFYVMFEL